MSSKQKPVLDFLKNSYNSSTCPDGEGSINVLFKEAKIAAKIYVKDKKVYAIDINNFPMEIIRRVITSEYVDDALRVEMLDKFEDNLSAPEIVEYVKELQIMPDSVLETYMKDLFLGAFDYLSTLGDAELKWAPKSSPKSFCAPSVNVERLWGIVESRRDEFQKIADAFNVGAHQVRNLTFRKTGKNAEPLTQTEANIYSLASGEWSILDFARQFGMSLFLTSYEIQKLWAKDKIELIYDSEFKIKPTQNQTEIIVNPDIEEETDPAVAVTNKTHRDKIDKIIEEVSYLEIKLAEIKNRLEELNE